MDLDSYSTSTTPANATARELSSHYTPPLENCCILSSSLVISNGSTFSIHDLTDNDDDDEDEDVEKNDGNGSRDGTDTLVSVKLDSVITRIIASPDGHSVFTSHVDKTLRKFSSTTLKLLIPPLEFATEVVNFVHSTSTGDGKPQIIAACTKDGNMHVVNARTLQKNNTKKKIHLSGTSHICVNSNATKIVTIATSSGLKQGLKLWDAKLHEITKIKQPHILEVQGCSFHTSTANANSKTSSDDVFYTWSNDKTIKIWSFSRRTCVQVITHPSIITLLTFNTTGTKFVTTCCSGSSLTVWDAKVNSIMSNDVLIELAFAVGFQGARQTFVTVCKDGGGRVWGDMSGGEEYCDVEYDSDVDLDDGENDHEESRDTFASDRSWERDSSFAFSPSLSSHANPAPSTSRLSLNSLLMKGQSPKNRAASTPTARSSNSPPNTFFSGSTGSTGSCAEKSPASPSHGHGRLSFSALKSFVSGRNSTSNSPRNSNTNSNVPPPPPPLSKPSSSSSLQTSSPSTTSSSGATPPPPPVRNVPPPPATPQSAISSSYSSKQRTHKSYSDGEEPNTPDPSTARRPAPLTQYFNSPSKGDGEAEAEAEAEGEGEAVDEAEGKGDSEIDGERSHALTPTSSSKRSVKTLTIDVNKFVNGSPTHTHTSSGGVVKRPHTHTHAHAHAKAASGSSSSGSSHSPKQYLLDNASANVKKLTELNAQMTILTSTVADLTRDNEGMRKQLSTHDIDAINTRSNHERVTNDLNMTHAKTVEEVNRTHGIERGRLRRDTELVSMQQIEALREIEDGKVEKGRIAAQGLVDKSAAVKEIEELRKEVGRLEVEVEGFKRDVGGEVSHFVSGVVKGAFVIDASGSGSGDSGSGGITLEKLSETLTQTMPIDPSTTNILLNTVKTQKAWEKDAKARLLNNIRQIVVDAEIEFKYKRQTAAKKIKNLRGKSNGKISEAYKLCELEERHISAIVQKIKSGLDEVVAIDKIINDVTLQLHLARDKISQKSWNGVAVVKGGVEHTKMTELTVALETWKETRRGCVDGLKRLEIERDGLAVKCEGSRGDYMGRREAFNGSLGVAFRECLLFIGDTGEEEGAVKTVMNGSVFRSAMSPLPSSKQRIKTPTTASSASASVSASSRIRTPGRTETKYNTPSNTSTRTPAHFTPQADGVTASTQNAAALKIREKLAKQNVFQGNFDYAKHISRSGGGVMAVAGGGKGENERILSLSLSATNQDFNVSGGLGGSKKIMWNQSNVDYASDNRNAAIGGAASVSAGANEYDFGNGSGDGSVMNLNGGKKSILETLRNCM